MIAVPRPAIPDAVVDALGGGDVLSWTAEPLTGSTGAATAGVDLVTVTLRSPSGDEAEQRVVRKRLRPLTQGRHAAASTAVDHWAYWRREALAYASGLLPIGPGLAAPRVLAIEADVVWTAMIDGDRERPEIAAQRLGSWQGTTPVPSVSWLAQHQLAQRIAASDLDLAVVDADPRVVDIWALRRSLLEQLSTLPFTVVHGDFSLGNLRAVDARTTVALDWATFGTGPVGADLASLTLSTGRWLVEEYLDGLDGAYPDAAVRRGHGITVALTHAGRVHWALSRGDTIDPAMTAMVLDRCEDAGILSEIR